MVGKEIFFLFKLTLEPFQERTTQGIVHGREGRCQEDKPQPSHLQNVPRGSLEEVKSSAREVHPGQTPLPAPSLLPALFLQSLCSDNKCRQQMTNPLPGREQSSRTDGVAPTPTHNILIDIRKPRLQGLVFLFSPWSALQSIPTGTEGKLLHFSKLNLPKNIYYVKSCHGP